jgi:hypothetical protein
MPSYWLKCHHDDRRAQESDVVRMQIQFTEDEVAALRREASERHVSISAVVRDAVDQRLDRPRQEPSLEERKARAKAACGLYHSGLGDVAARHDEYFADSILD